MNFSIFINLTSKFSGKNSSMQKGYIGHMFRDRLRFTTIKVRLFFFFYINIAGYQEYYICMFLNRKQLGPPQP